MRGSNKGDPVYNPETSFPRSFKGIWIPKELWFDDRLTPEEKIFMAEIDSLDGDKKHCYASNDYFAHFFKCQERKVQCMLAKLKKMGFIEYVAFDGRTRRIKSNLKTVYTLFNTSDMQDNECDKHSLTPLQCPIRHPEPIRGSIEPDNIVYNIDKKEEEREVAKLLSRAPHVSTSEKDHKKLVEQHGEEKTALLYQELSDWKANSKKSKWRPNDYLTILKWVVEALKEKEKKGVSGDEPKALVTRIAENFKERAKTLRITIDVGSSYVEFRNFTNGYVRTLSYQEKGFKEQLEGIMRKVGLI
jgi:hypothetical protein